MNTKPEQCFGPDPAQISGQISGFRIQEDL